MRSLRPDATIHQPTPPCTAPSAKMPASRHRRARSDPIRARQKTRAAEEHDADHAAEQPVAPLPPEDGLEVVERHAAIHPGIAGWLVFSNSACRRRRTAAADPVTGFHSVIESPDSVSRVAPPTNTMAKIKAATANSQMRTSLSCLMRDPSVISKSPFCRAGRTSSQSNIVIQSARSRRLAKAARRPKTLACGVVSLAAQVGPLAVATPTI